MAREEHFKFPHIVVARDGDVDDGEARTGERLVNEHIAGLPVGAVMTAVI